MPFLATSMRPGKHPLSFPCYRIHMAASADLTEINFVIAPQACTDSKALAAKSQLIFSVAIFVFIFIKRLSFFVRD
jgi:hypothetical protein